MTISPTISTPLAPLETPGVAFSATVTALRALGAALGPAVDVRFEAPPGFRAVPNRDGVLNPTLDLVTDPRRVELGRAITAAHRDLVGMAHALRLRTEDLRGALAAWEGTA